TKHLQYVTPQVDVPPLLNLVQLTLIAIDRFEAVEYVLRLMPKLTSFKLIGK
ncbi:unnamed protein product, partial [Didymodactylos carnosus]